MNLLATTNQSLTMSSREIAELTGKRHDNVKRDINKMIFELDEDILKFEGTYIDGSNRQQIEYRLDRDHTDCLLTGYSSVLRMKVIKRWRELESANQVALPSVKELALMVIKAEEEKEAAMLEVDRLQGVCNTITAQFAKGTSAPVFCRQLNGVNVQQVNNRLIEMGMLLKTQRGLEPTSYARDKYFKVIYIDKTNEKTGWSGQKAETTLTLAGAKWLYRAYISNRLPMKKTWDGNLVHVEFNH